VGRYLSYHLASYSFHVFVHLLFLVFPLLRSEVNVLLDEFVALTFSLFVRNLPMPAHIRPEIYDSITTKWLETIGRMGVIVNSLLTVMNGSSGQRHVPQSLASHRYQP